VYSNGLPVNGLLRLLGNVLIVAGLASMRDAARQGTARLALPEPQYVPPSPPWSLRWPADLGPMAGLFMAMMAIVAAHAAAAEGPDSVLAALTTITLLALLVNTVYALLVANTLDALSSPSGRT